MFPFLIEQHASNSLLAVTKLLWGFIPSWVTATLIFFTLSINKYSGKMVTILLRDPSFVTLIVLQLIAGISHVGLIYYLSVGGNWERFAATNFVLYCLDFCIVIASLLYSYNKLHTLDPERLGISVIETLERSVKKFRKIHNKKYKTLHFITLERLAKFHSSSAIISIRQLANIVKQVTKENNFDVAIVLITRYLSVWKSFDLISEDIGFRRGFNQEELIGDEQSANPFQILYLNELEEMISSVLTGPKQRVKAIPITVSKEIYYQYRYIEHNEQEKQLQFNFGTLYAEADFFYRVADDFISKKKKSLYGAFLDEVEKVYEIFLSISMKKSVEKRSVEIRGLLEYTEKISNLFKSALDSEDTYFIRRTLKMVEHVYTTNRLHRSVSEKQDLLDLDFRFFKDLIKLSVDAVQQKKFLNLIEVFKTFVLRINTDIMTVMVSTIWKDYKEIQFGHYEVDKKYYLMKFYFVWLAFWEFQKDEQNQANGQYTIEEHIERHKDIFEKNSSGYQILLKSVKQNEEYWDKLILGQSSKYFIKVENLINVIVFKKT